MGQINRENVRLKADNLYFWKIKKFFILPQFPLISAVVEEGLRKCSFKIKKNHQIHVSSNVLKTHSRWGRMILKCLFFKSSWFQLSNALSLKRFGQKFANLENFENFDFFWKFHFFHEIQHFSNFLCEKLKILKFLWNSFFSFSMNNSSNRSRKRAF